MARAIWSGVLTFGLVSVPVELYSATEAAAVRWLAPGSRAPR
jgi:DNA end-binding protein Ku